MASLHDSEERGVSVQTVLFVVVEAFGPPPFEFVELPLVFPTPPAVEFVELDEFVELVPVVLVALPLTPLVLVAVEPLDLAELVPLLQLQSQSQLHAPPVPFAVCPGPTASSPKSSQPANCRHKTGRHQEHTTFFRRFMRSSFPLVQS